MITYCNSCRKSETYFFYVCVLIGNINNINQYTWRQLIKYYNSHLYSIAISWGKSQPIIAIKSGVMINHGFMIKSSSINAMDQ